jgi:methylmalonyl-CoA/ethylmalonyl-CoA epimerase
MHVSGIAASYYWAKDLERATAFYTMLLGAPPTASMPGIFAEWVLADDAAFGIYHGAGEGFKPSNSVMFAVDDVAAAVADAKTHGIPIAEHIEETPVCWMAFGTDSEGNGFILHARK